LSVILTYISLFTKFKHIPQCSHTVGKWKGRASSM